MSDAITLCKFNHSSIRLNADRGVLQELYEHFSFFASGYKFMPLYRNGMWDGKVRLFSLKNNCLPAGLYKELAKFATERRYVVRVDASSLPIAEQCSEEYSCDLPLSSGNKSIEIRDYQLDSLKHLTRHKRGILISPTGSGKSLMIYLLLRHYAKSNFLIIVPTVQLVEQMYSDFADYSSNDPSFDVNEDTVHRIYSGHDKNLMKARIVVSTWQSLQRMPDSCFKHFDAVVGDEAHLCKSKELSRIMNACVNAEIRIGTTGTLDGTKVSELQLIGLFGPVYRAITTKELIDNDTLAETKIKVLHLSYDQNEYKLMKNKDYHSEISYIVSHQKRNRFISRLALSQKQNTLILFNYVENHGKPLHQLIEAMNPDKTRKIFFIAGEVKGLDREDIRHIMEKETNAILVASLGTFAQGVNIKNLQNIIFASPTKSQVRVLQSIGRGLRKYKDSTLTVYDIIDDFSGSRKKKNFALQHGIERLKIYSREQFEFTTYKIDMHQK